MCVRVLPDGGQEASAHRSESTGASRMSTSAQHHDIRRNATSRLLAQFTPMPGGLASRQRSMVSRHAAAYAGRR